MFFCIIGVMPCILSADGTAPEEAKLALEEQKKS